VGTVIGFQRFIYMKRRSLGERPELRLVEGHASHMSQNLNCPSCEQPMTLLRMVRAPHPADDKRRFHCAHCNLDYLVEGQMPGRS
jgi:transposase-like protein